MESLSPDTLSNFKATNTATALSAPQGCGSLNHPVIAGVAAGLKQLDSGIKVIGVEPEWENDAKQSFESGKRVVLEKPSASIADAIKIQTLGSLTFPLTQRYVDEVADPAFAHPRQALRAI